MSKFLSIDKCPRHGYFAISIGDTNGATRLTRTKCCGSWDTVHRWKMSDDDIRRMAKELLSEVTSTLTTTTASAPSGLVDEEMK